MKFDIKKHKEILLLLDGLNNHLALDNQEIKKNLDNENRRLELNSVSLEENYDSLYKAIVARDKKAILRHLVIYRANLVNISDQFYGIAEEISKLLQDGDYFSPEE